MRTSTTAFKYAHKDNFQPFMQQNFKKYSIRNCYESIEVFECEIETYRDHGFLDG